MKTKVIMLILVLVSWGASAQHDHSTITNKSAVSTSIKVEHSQSVTSIIDNYLALKNALAEDDAKKAANSGKMLFDAFGKFNLSSQSASQQKELKDILDDAKEHAEHISLSSGDIEHQREHFEILGTDIKDMIVITGADRNLYQIYCPMYNDGKGGKWLNESKEVKNPFFGSKMLKCGNVVQEITVK